MTISPGGSDWATDELDLIVTDYLIMLRSELADSAYSKTIHRDVLMRSLHRSKGPIEFKHQNIAASPSRPR